MHEGRSTWQKIRRFLRQAQCSLDEINRKVDRLMAQQDKANELTERLGKVTEGIRRDIEAIKAANPAVDFTALEERVSGLEGLDAENPDAETPPA
jgi:TATA-binding protein-associated factor Taf7